MLLRTADLWNNQRISGFEHVGYCASPRHPARKPFQAYAGRRNEKERREGGLDSWIWKGPRRATALEAAQDYCDYINGSGVMPAPQLKAAGHAKPVSSIPSSPEAIEARRVLREEAKARREGRIGSVYLAIEQGLYQGSIKSAAASVTVKIGHTYLDPPEARLAGLQTGNPRLLKMVASRPGSEADEDALHAKFIHHNILGEWFWNHSDILREFGLA